MKMELLEHKPVPMPVYP